MKSALSQQRVPDVVVKQLRNAVTTSRRLRGAVAAATGTEVESLKIAVGRMYRFAAMMRMDLHFKACIAQCGDGDDEKCYYDVSIELRPQDERASGGELLNGPRLAAKCAEELRTSETDADGGVRFVDADGEYASARDTYTLQFVFDPPPAEPAPPPPPPQKKQRRGSARDAAAEKQPSADEFVEFFKKRPDKWNLLGHNVVSWFSVKRARK